MNCGSRTQAAPLNLENTKSKNETYLMKSFFIQPSLDATGFWASAICALHCVAVPILLSFAAFSGLAFLETPAFEYAILSISIIIGVSSLLPSYFRHHRKFSALCLFVTGFLMIVLSRMTELEFWEIGLTTAGVTLVATAHILNYKLCRHGNSSRTGER